MRKFHEHQQNAYDQTSRLMLLLSSAIAGTILLSGLAITYVAAVVSYLNGVPPEEHWGAVAVTYILACLAASVVVAAGTIIKQFQLRAGGKVIATDLGGRLVDEPGSVEERRLINVVEEMSIASGIPVPAVYLLDGHDSINAFAAGHDPHDAVIGVTYGAIRYLERDELQGVIAHEFSHILNGDMRLNLKMVGWLHGVLAVTIVAEHLIKIGRELVEDAGRLQGLGMIALGVFLWPVGLIGTFMSLLVKAATSRQREFLADAFAVQFTRHPDALATAFKRLAGHRAGSRVNSPKAIEASHLFLAEGCGTLASMLASHPPLVIRILRLDPSWDGVPIYPEKHTNMEYHGAFQNAMGLVSQLAPAARTAPPEPGEWLDNRIREVPDMLATVEFAESVLNSLPEPIVAITEAVGGTSLMLYGLWLAHAADESAAYELLSDTQVSRLSALVPYLRQMESPQKVLLLDRAIKEIHDTPAAEQAELRQMWPRFADLAEERNVFHWMWNGIVGEALGLMERPKPRYGCLKQIEGACEVVLSQVCYSGDSTAYAGFSFQRGLANLGLENIGLLDQNECTWEKFQLAIDLVAQLAPHPRRQMLVACSSALSSDQIVTPDEAYIIRGICQRLGYNVPCVLPGQPIKPGT